MLAFARGFAKAPHQGLKPMFDRVIIQRIEVPSVTNSGLYIPDSVKGKHNEGIVVEVGTGRRMKDGSYIPPTLKPGDRVILSDWGGSEVKIQGKEYLILREEDVLGTLA